MTPALPSPEALAATHADLDRLLAAPPPHKPQRGRLYPLRATDRGAVVDPRGYRVVALHGEAALFVVPRRGA